MWWQLLWIPATFLEVRLFVFICRICFSCKIRRMSVLETALVIFRNVPPKKFCPKCLCDIHEFHKSCPLFFFFSCPLCRKACMTCGCSMVDHAPGSDIDDDQRMGRLLADSPCSHLTAKVKGGGGLRMYKRNRMIVTNPVVSRKDPTFNTTTYDWAPAGLNQTLVRISTAGRSVGTRPSWRRFVRSFVSKQNSWHWVAKAEVENRFG